MNRIKLLREERGLSLNDLRDSLLEKKGVKISKASLNNYERGEQTPKTETWKILADFFRVDIQYIMGLSPIKNPIENKFYELSLSNLVDLVEQNGENVTTIRKSVASFSNILQNIEKNTSLVNSLYELLSSISRLSGDDDSLIFDSDGNYLNNKEMVKLILKEKKSIEKNISMFVDIAIDKIPEHSAIEIDASSLFYDKNEQDEYFGEPLSEYNFEDFLSDQKNREFLQQKLDQKIKNNLDKIKKKSEE